MSQNKLLIGFGIGTGAAAGAAAAVRAWKPEWSRWADVIGAAAGAGVGGAMLFVKPLKGLATGTIAGAAISQAPKIIEQLVAGAGGTAGVGYIMAERRLGEIRADVRQLGGVSGGGSANIGTHFGAIPIAGTH